MATLEYASMPTNLTEGQVRQVAARQREVIYCILANVVLLGVSIALPPQFKPFVGIGYLAVMVFAAVALFRLAAKFYHPVMAVLMVVALVIPLIGLLVLLSVNGKATNLLKRNGIHVGLLGARV